MAEQRAVPTLDDGGQVEVEPKTTSYVVLVAVAAFVEPEPPFMVWREAGVIDVPRRTTRASVVEQAKGLAAPHVDDGGTRMRVYPLDQHVEAELSMEQPPPQLTATVL